MALPHETTVWKRSARRPASAFTATFPLCDTSATGPGSSGASASPHIAAPEPIATMPFPFGPHTGSEWRSATSLSRSSYSTPRATSPKPAPYTTAPPQPSAPASSSTSATDAAGMPTTTASGTPGSSDRDGKQSNPCADERFGFTPHTGPAKPAPRRLSSVSPAYESSRSLAPTTAMLRGRSSRPSSISAASAPRPGAPGLAR